MWKKLMIVLWLFSISEYALADDLFATGWGHAFDVSPEGTLIFTLLQCFGIWACFKSLRLLYAYHHGKQSRFGNGACFMMFMAGVLIFYAHQTANAIYNSV